jgi:hypothetical protein
MRASTLRAGLPGAGLVLLLVLAGCAAPAAGGASDDPSDQASEAPQTPGLLDGVSTPADLGALLESAGIDPGALETCRIPLPNGVGQGLVSALPATFGDAYEASLLFQSDPNWPFATGDDNRMTVKLRDDEDPDGETALCVYALEAAGYTRDVTVVFSDGTWGEIGNY